MEMWGMERRKEERKREGGKEGKTEERKAEDAVRKGLDPPLSPS
jgi:hypothetical protein